MGYDLSVRQFTSLIFLPVVSLVLGQYPAVAVAGSPTGVVPSSQHQMPITSQPQPDMYMSGVQMNGGGMGGAEYQAGSNVGANVQSQVSDLLFATLYLQMIICYLSSVVPLAPNPPPMQAQNGYSLFYLFLLKYLIEFNPLV